VGPEYSEEHDDMPRELDDDEGGHGSLPVAPGCWLLPVLLLVAPGEHPARMEDYLEVRGL
jgi:hypothetical protein